MPKARSTSKKTIVKKTAPKSAAVKKLKITSLPRNFLSRRNIIIAVALIVTGIIVFLFKGLLIAAMVNGQPVTRIELIQQLEKQSGKTTLESIITKNLILQEMKKKNITATGEEISSEIKKIEDALKIQGRTLPDALSQQGITRSDLEEQVKIQKMIEKLFSKESVVKDEEIDKYLKENKDSIPEGQDEKTLRESAKEQLRQQKLSSEFQKWLTNIKSKAKINYFVNF